MSEFKGSPGPWVVIQNGFTECAVKDAQGVWLTYRAGDSNRLSNAEVEANARIMAAAPELLDALRETMYALSDAVGIIYPAGVSTEEFGEKVGAARVKFHAVVAKALGEPRFPETFCSSCGKALGPGDEGVSHCGDHK